MKENELYKRAIENDILNKERIRTVAISSARGIKKGNRRPEIKWTRALITSFLLIFCVATVVTLSQNDYGARGIYTNPSDYGDVYQLLSTIRQSGGNSQLSDGVGKATDDVISDNTSEYSGRATGVPDYSDTNLQVAGVQEADVVKTDGKYIYALSAEKLYIVSAIDGKLALASKISLSTAAKQDADYAFEMYVEGDKLIVLKRTPSIYALDDVLMVDGAPGAPLEFAPQNIKVTAVVFDISDKSKPKKITQLSQSGDYVSSRMVDNFLYLVTSYYVYPYYMERTNVGTYVPSTSSDRGKDVPVAADDIYITPHPQTTSYVTISGIDMNQPEDFVSTKAILGNASNVYASLDNLYVTNYDGVTENGYYKDKTDIIKFAIKDGHIRKKATASVYGTLLNQFSMDEHDGFLRIVTTANQYKVAKDGDTVSISNNDKGVSGLTVLDRNLKKVGKISDLGKGEQVYSVRFDGKTGYVVTYRQVDPLYAIDLSIPTRPKVISALKIPGFSEYMQPYGEGLLFGLGKEVNADNMVVGLKLSMFDVSDKTDVREIDKYVLAKNYNWSEASWNHKAILVSPERNLIAFPSYDSYFIFSYANGSFKELKQIKLGQENTGFGPGIMRGLFIGDYFYVVADTEILSMNISGFQLSQKLQME